MAASKAECLRHIRNYLCDWYNLPASWVTAATKTAKFPGALLDLGRWINKSNWTTVHVYPDEIMSCETVGAVADLVFRKQK